MTCGIERDPFSGLKFQWSKIRFIQKYLNDYDYVFWSDGDAIITNPSLRLEDHVIPLLPDGKDMLWCIDACGNLNNGHLLFRGKSAWAMDFLERCYAQTDLLSHIWWDNAAFIRLFETVAGDKARIETIADPSRFNSYIFSRTNRADDTSVRLFRPGDFLIHFAGVYEPWNIHRFMLYAQRCLELGKSMDTDLLNRWRDNPPLNRSQAVEDVKNSV
jgi:hypothetical protein